jgi:hypothetical protein
VRRVVTYLGQVGEEIPGYLTTGSRATNDLPVDTERLDVLWAPPSARSVSVDPLMSVNNSVTVPVGCTAMTRDYRASARRGQGCPPCRGTATARSQAVRKRNGCRHLPPGDLTLAKKPL